MFGCHSKTLLLLKTVLEIGFLSHKQTNSPLCCFTGHPVSWESPGHWNWQAQGGAWVSRNLQGATWGFKSQLAAGQAAVGSVAKAGSQFTLFLSVSLGSPGLGEGTEGLGSQDPTRRSAMGVAWGPWVRQHHGSTWSPWLLRRYFHVQVVKSMFGWQVVS